MHSVCSAKKHKQFHVRHDHEENMQYNRFLHMYVRCVTDVRLHALYFIICHYGMRYALLDGTVIYFTFLHAFKITSLNQLGEQMK